jgi:hypothetical protein
VAERLQAAMALLPPILGGAPTQPLDVGRTSRVVQPAQRTALAARDGGCVFPGCARPLAWCEAHHLLHWLHGGPTDLANLALLCRAHHRAVHEGGWHLARGPDGRFTATPPNRPHRRPPNTHRRHSTAACTATNLRTRASQPAGSATVGDYWLATVLLAAVWLAYAGSSSGRPRSQPGSSSDPRLRRGVSVTRNVCCWDDWARAAEPTSPGRPADLTLHLRDPAQRP